ncbi:MAG: MFS transporter, partial [Pseudomonadales bacterium]|nr:MFS transporter [Pseudomonadales bacterium]
MDRLELRAAASIGLLYVIRMLGLFMVLPVLPLLGPDLESATPALVGLALGIYGLSQACLQIPLGLVSDRIGRKPVIVGGLLIFVVGSIVAGLSESIYGVIAGRLLQGCGAVASTLLALMSDLTRIDQRSKSMAIIGMSIGGSFGVSLILGPLISNHFGLSGVFWFGAWAGLL